MISVVAVTWAIVLSHEPLTNHDFWMSVKENSNKFFFFFSFWKNEILFKSREFSLEILTDSCVGDKLGLEYLKAQNELNYFYMFIVYASHRYIQRHTEDAQ